MKEVLATAAQVAWITDALVDQYSAYVTPGAEESRLLVLAPRVEGGGDDCVRRGCLHQYLACCRIIWRLGTRVAVETVVGVLGHRDIAGLRDLRPHKFPV